MSDCAASSIRSRDGWRVIRRLYRTFYLETQSQRVAIGIDDHRSAVGELAEQNRVDERLLDLRMDQSRHRTRAVGGVVAVLCQPRASRLRHLQRDFFFRELHA